MFNGGRAPLPPPKPPPRVANQAPTLPPILLPQGRSSTAPSARSYAPQVTAAAYHPSGNFSPAGLPPAPPSQAAVNAVRNHPVASEARSSVQKAAGSQAVQNLVKQVMASLQGQSSPWVLTPQQDAQQRLHDRNFGVGGETKLQARILAFKLSQLGQYLGVPATTPDDAKSYDTNPTAHIPGAGANQYPQIPAVVAPWPGAKMPKPGKPYYGGGIQRFGKGSLA